jgi:hypothetical protein
LVCRASPFSLFFKMRKNCTQVLNVNNHRTYLIALQIHRVSPLGSTHVV